MYERSSSGPRYVLWLLFIAGVIALIQFLRMEAEIYQAQSSVRNVSAGISFESERNVREVIAEALTSGGFDVDPKAITIKKNRAGTATIDLIAAKDVKILFVPVRREVSFHVEAAYIPGI